MNMQSLYKLVVMIVMLTGSPALLGMRPKQIARKPTAPVTVKRTLSEAIQALMQKESLSVAEQQKLWGYLERDGLKANRVEEYFKKVYSKAALSEAETAKALDLIDEIETAQPELAQRLRTRLFPPAVPAPKPALLPSQPKPSVKKPIAAKPTIQPAPAVPVLIPAGYPQTREPEFRQQIAQLQTKITEQEQIIRSITQELDQLTKVKEERDALRFEVEQLQIAAQKRYEEEQHIATEKAKEEAARHEQERQELAFKLAQERLKTEAAQQATKAAQAAAAQEKIAIERRARLSREEAMRKATAALQKVQRPISPRPIQPAPVKRIEVQPAPVRAPVIEEQPAPASKVAPTESATAPAQEEDAEIDQIVAEHSISRGMEGKIGLTKAPIRFAATSFDHANAAVKQLEALVQKVSETDSTNYCGAYAAYNMWCLRQKEYKELLKNRALFATYFKSMLQAIKQLRGENFKFDVGFLKRLDKAKLPGKYEELMQEGGNNEIGYILNSVFDINPNQYVTLPLIQGEIIGNQHNQLIADFKNKKSNNLYILYNVSGHWISLRVARLKSGQILFMIADSLNNRDWQSEDTINDVVAPLYNFLTEKFKELTPDDIWDDLVRNGLAEKETKEFFERYYLKQPHLSANQMDEAFAKLQVISVQHQALSEELTGRLLEKMGQ